MRLSYFSLFLFLFSLVIPYNQASAKARGPLSYNIKTTLPLLIQSKFYDSCSGSLCKNIAQVRAFLQQKDLWSCGYRVLFHALACERALECPASFHKRLKKELSCQELLDQVYNLIECEKELNNFDIEQAAQSLGFSQRLVIIHQDDKTVKMLGDVTIEYPTDKLSCSEKKKFIRKIRDQKLHATLKHLCKIVVNKNKPAYIVCGAYKHWTLFILIPLQNSIKLYMIDSCNTALVINHQPTLDLLLPYLELSNNQLTKKKIRLHRHIAKATESFKLSIPLEKQDIHQLLDKLLLFVVIAAGLLLIASGLSAILRQTLKNFK